MPKYFASDYLQVPLFFYYCPFRNYWYFAVACRCSPVQSLADSNTR
jgi:hypothetical protein